MKSFFENLLAQVGLQKRYKEVICVILLILGLGLIGGGYSLFVYFNNKKEKAAYAALNEAIEEYSIAATQKSDEKKWQEVINTFDTAFERYGRTNMAPYILAYKSQALIYNNKLKEAIDVMQKAVDSLKKKSPLYYIYSIKLALMKIDSKNPELITTGKKDLEELANDPKNLQKDEAIYYAGAYALYDKNETKAKQLWNKISATDTIWGKKAKEQLSSLK